MLGELEKRLTQPPDCLPACAAVEHATVKLNGDALIVKLDINAARTVAVPLPATAAQWWPLDARDGDRPAVISRDESGQLSIALKEGAHSVELTGPVAHVDRFELPFPMPPGGVTLDLKGWRAYGEQNGHLRGAALQFEREAPTLAGRSAASLAPEPIAPYFRLSRTFEFGLEWRIQHHARTNRTANRQHPLCSSVGCRRVAARRPRARGKRTHHRRADAGRAAGGVGQRAHHGRYVAAHRPAAAAMDGTVDAGAVELLARRLRRRRSDEARGRRFAGTALPAVGRRDAAGSSDPTGAGTGRDDHGRARRRHRSARRSRAPHHARARVVEQPGRQLPGAHSRRRESSERCPRRPTAADSHVGGDAAVAGDTGRTPRRDHVGGAGSIGRVDSYERGRTSGARLQHRVASHAAVRPVAAVRRRSAPRPGRLVLGRDAGGDRRCVGAVAHSRVAALGARRCAARFRHESLQPAERPYWLPHGCWFCWRACDTPSSCSARRGDRSIWCRSSSPPCRSPR